MKHNLVITAELFYLRLLKRNLPSEASEKNNGGLAGRNFFLSVERRSLR